MRFPATCGQEKEPPSCFWPPLESLPHGHPKGPPSTCRSYIRDGLNRVGLVFSMIILRQEGISAEFCRTCLKQHCPVPDFSHPCSHRAPSSLRGGPELVARVDIPCVTCLCLHVGAAKDAGYGVSHHLGPQPTGHPLLSPALPIHQHHFFYSL